MQEMKSEREYRFDAFISYRHVQFDKAVAERLQKQLEAYKPPKGVHCGNVTAIRRIFRDESELPTSGNLDADIKSALNQSRYLIVICSEETRHSHWCTEEITYFKSLNGNTNDRVLTLLIKGEVSEVFPPALCEEERTVTLEEGIEKIITVQVEPLAANIIAKTKNDSFKKLKTEFLRIAAPILGCSFDDLFRRHQKRALRNIVVLATAISVVVLSFGSFALYQALIINEKNKALIQTNGELIEQKAMAVINGLKAEEQRDNALKNQSLYLADLSKQQLAGGDKMMAILLAIEALPKNLKDPEKPYVNEAWGALFNAVYDRGMAHTTLYHMNAVKSASFSPDGSRIVSTSDDRTAKVWDVKSGSLLQTLKGHQGEVIEGQFTLDGKHIITESYDSIRTWDAESGEELAVFHLKDSLLLDLSQNGLIAALRDNQGRINIYNLETQKLLVTLQGDYSKFPGIVMSFDGKIGVVLSGKPELLVYDLESGQQTGELIGHTDTIRSVSYSPDNSKILTCSNDYSAKVWDKATSKCLFTLADHNGPVRRILSSKDGKYLLTASNDKTAHLYEAKTGKLLQTMALHTEDVNVADFSPDGRSFITGSFDKVLYLWETETGRLLMKLSGHNREITLARFSPDSRFLVTGAFTENYFKLWDTKPEGFKPVSLTISGNPSSLSFSPQNDKLAVASGENNVYVFDKKDFTLNCELMGTGQVLNTCFSPDGNRVMTSGSEQMAVIWDAQTGKRLLNLSESKAGVQEAIYSPNGKLIATLTKDSTIFIWDAVTGEQRARFGQELVDMCFSPDSKSIFASNSQNKGLLFNCNEGKILSEFNGHSDAINSMSFSKDGLTLLTASKDQTARIWNTQTGACEITLKGHTGSINSARFNNQNDRVVTASEDESARVWDARSGKQLSSLTNARNSVIDAKFSEDNRNVFTVARDGKILINDAETGKLITPLNRDFPMDPISLMLYGDEVNVVDLGVNSQISLNNGDYKYYVHIWTLNSQALKDGALELLNGRNLIEDERQQFYVNN